MARRILWAIAISARLYLRDKFHRLKARRGSAFSCLVVRQQAHVVWKATGDPLSLVLQRGMRVDGLRTRPSRARREVIDDESRDEVLPCELDSRCRLERQHLVPGLIINHFSSSETVSFAD